MQSIPFTVAATTCALLASVASARATCPSPITPPFKKVTHSVTKVLGFEVDKYAWFDSKCLQRTISLKQEGAGNAGHGGYAVQMTYQVTGSAGTTTVVVNKETTGDGGFGYFVSHERYRTFVDNKSNTIARKIFNVDDSPLGLMFPVVGSVLNPIGDAAAERYATTYHHFGTIAPDAVNAEGNDTTPLPLTKSSYADYPLPVTMTWVFQAQTDAPRYDVDVDLTQVAKADRVGFDVRAPYGVMVFDGGLDGIVDKIQWGDRFLFATTAEPVTRDTGWTWNAVNPGDRFNAMIAGRYEMGLYEPLKFAKSALDDTFAEERGSTSTAFNHGKGCAEGETQLLPCDWEWPYQGLQFSLPTNSLTTPTNFKKIAWGSTAFYGAGPGLTKVFDSPTTSEAFVGFPASKHIQYSICILLGLTTTKGLTLTAAEAATPNCASTKFP